MRQSWAARAAVLTTFLALFLITDAAQGANVYDWAAARRKAVRASSQRERDAAWGDVAYNHVRLAEYYKRLASICARAQTSIAEAWTFDKTAPAAAVHAFIAAGRFDSAAAWAGKDPTLRPLLQFAQAKGRGEPFPYGSASEPVTELALAGLHVAKDPGELSVLTAKLGTSSPVAAFLTAIITDDAPSLPGVTEKVEDLLAHPLGVDNPLLDQFGDPLIYSALARAHALMAVNACHSAAADATAAAVPYFRLLSGLAYYSMGNYAAARDDLNAAAGPDIAGIASAVLAGIAWRNGDRKGANDLADQSLTAEKQNPRGEALMALARVEAGLPGSEWGALRTARQIIRDKPDSRIQIYAAHWATALLAGDMPLDSIKERYWLAAEKLKPDVRHNFPNIYCSPQELFCADYISALTDGGAHGNGLDYLDAFNGLMELANLIPATRSLKEGLRCLALMGNQDIKDIPRQ